MAQVSFAIRDDHIGTELDSESGLQKQTLNLSVTSGSNRSFSLQKLGQNQSKTCNMYENIRLALGENGWIRFNRSSLFLAFPGMIESEFGPHVPSR